MEGRERRCKHKLTGRMIAPHAAPLFCACAALLFLARHTTAVDPDPTPTNHDAQQPKKIELFNGVSVQIPKNNTEKLLSFEIDTQKDFETGRGSGKGKQKKLMERILPMFILPFLIQSTIVPFFLSMLKFMLLKSMMVGKLALALILLNAFKNHNSVKGRDAQMADVHYGYSNNGMEFGALWN